MELYLSHNPYTIETYFSIDGDKCNAAWFTNLTQANGMSSRLQMWIMRFFDELHNAYPTKEKFYLTFMMPDLFSSGARMPPCTVLL